MNDSAIARCHGAVVVDNRDFLMLTFFFFFQMCILRDDTLYCILPEEAKEFLRQNNTIGPFSRMTVDLVAVSGA